MGRLLCFALCPPPFLRPGGKGQWTQGYLAMSSQHFLYLKKNQVVVLSLHLWCLLVDLEIVFPMLVLCPQTLVAPFLLQYNNHTHSRLGYVTRYLKLKATLSYGWRAGIKKEKKENSNVATGKNYGVASILNWSKCISDFKTGIT